MGWTFTNEAGVALDIDDGSDYSVRRWSGGGLISPQPRMTDRFGKPGAILRRVHTPVRVMELHIDVFGSDQSDHEDNLEALVTHLAGSLGSDDPVQGVLSYTASDASVRALRCFAAGGASLNEALRVSNVWTRLMITFVAPHPMWYNATEQSATGTIGTGAALTFPFTFPGTFGLDGLTAGITATVSGTAETFSLKWTAPGPSVAPALYHAGLNREISFPGLTVPTGLQLEVRMGWRPDGISDHQAILVPASGGTEQDVIGYMATASRFFYLKPGANSLEASQTNDVATVHTVAWFDEYLAVA